MPLLLILGIPVLSIVMFVTWIWLTSIAFKKSPLWGALLVLFTPFSTIFFAIRYWEETKKPFLIHMSTYAGFVLIMVMLFSSLGGFEMMEMARQLESGEISEEEIPAFIEQQMTRMEESGLMSDEDKAKLAELRAELRAQQQRQQQGEPSDPGASYEDLMRDVRASQTTDTTIGPGKGGGAAATATASASGPVVQELPPVGYDPMRLTSAAGSSASALPTAWDPLLEGRVSVDEAKRHVGRLFRVEVRAGQEFKGRLVEVGRRDLVFEKYMSGGWVTYEVGRSEIVALKLRGRR